MHLSVNREAALPMSTGGGASSAKMAMVAIALSGIRGYVSVWPLAALTLARLPSRPNRSRCSTTCSRFATMGAKPMFVVS